MVTLRVSILHVVKHGDVIASEAKQPLNVTTVSKGLLRRCAPRNDVASVNEGAARIYEKTNVIASEAKQPFDVTTVSKGLPRRASPSSQ